MKPDDYEGLVEFRARALCSIGETGQAGMWEALPDHMRRPYKLMARASILAEYEAGIVPCPVEATEEMAQATGGAIGCYVTKEEVGAGIAASPYTPKEAAIESRAKPTADTR